MFFLNHARTLSACCEKKIHFAGFEKSYKIISFIKQRLKFLIDGVGLFNQNRTKERTNRFLKCLLMAVATIKRAHVSPAFVIT